MYSRQPSRILHVDGDTFFASCEVALDASLSGKPVWVGGGRRGDGIVIAANREAKRFGVHTGMACFEAKRVCAHGVLAKPQYEEYRRLSKEMFQIMEQYTPTLVPMSIDEGFLDLTTMSSHIWRDITAESYVNGLRARIQEETGLPVSAGLGRSTWMAKLATSVAKPGFVEVPPDREREFLAEHHVSELAGVGKRRERSLQVLGARTFGDVARLPSTVLKQKFGIWGQQLWLFANGQWNEPLLLEVKDRTTISSSTTLPYDEPDYEAARIFALSESTRMIGQLRREGLQAREMSLVIRFADFNESSAGHRFDHPQFRNSVINGMLEQLLNETMFTFSQPIRQIRICFSNLKPLDTQPTLWGTTDAERWGALDTAMEQLKNQWGCESILTGAQYALRHQDATHANPNPKCPFVPSREMAQKLWGRKLERLDRRHQSS